MLQQFEIRTGDYQDTWVYDPDDYTPAEYLVVAGLTDPYVFVSDPKPASALQTLRFIVANQFAGNGHKIACLGFASSSEPLIHFLFSL